MSAAPELLGRLAAALGCGPLDALERTPGGLLVAWQPAPGVGPRAALAANAAAHPCGPAGPYVFSYVVAPHDGRLARRLTLPLAALPGLLAGRPLPDGARGVRAWAAESGGGTDERRPLGRSGRVWLQPGAPPVLAARLWPVRPADGPADVSDALAQVLLERAGGTPEQYPALAGDGPGGLIRCAAPAVAPDRPAARAAAARLLEEAREDARILAVVLTGGTAALDDGEEIP
jgi:hypothetical protein